MEYVLEPKYKKVLEFYNQNWDKVIKDFKEEGYGSKYIIMISRIKARLLKHKKISENATKKEDIERTVLLFRTLEDKLTDYCKK